MSSHIQGDVFQPGCALAKFIHPNTLSEEMINKALSPNSESPKITVTEKKIFDSSPKMNFLSKVEESLSSSPPKKQTITLIKERGISKSVENCFLSNINLATFIKDMKFSPLETENYIKALSYTVLKFHLYHPSTSDRLRKNESLYGSTLTLPFTFYLEKESDEKAVKIQIYALKSPQSHLGKGAYKSVKKSFSLHVDFENLVISKVSETVIQRLAKGTNLKHQEKVITGLLHQENLIKKYGSEIKIAPLTIDRTYDSKSSKKKHEFEQLWFNGDLNRVITMGQLPLTIFSNSKEKALNSIDKLDILFDVAGALQKMHQNHIVHRDIKPGNILVRLGFEGRWEGYVSDFDMTQKIGLGPQNVYTYWDRCSRNGTVLPSTDVYGLVLTTAELFLPNFISFMVEISKRRLIFDKQVKGNFLKTTFILKLSPHIQSKSIGHINDFDRVYDLITNLIEHSEELPFDKIYKELDESLKRFLILNDSLHTDTTQFIKTLIKDLKSVKMIIELVEEALIRSCNLESFVNDNRELEWQIISNKTEQINEAIALLSNEPRLYLSLDLYLETLRIIRELYVNDVELI